MAAGGYKEFVAGETLDEDEINDYLMQGVLVFAGSAARGSAITSPVEGQFSFRTDDDVVEFYDGSGWVALSAPTFELDFLLIAGGGGGGGAAVSNTGGGGGAGGYRTSAGTSGGGGTAEPKLILTTGIPYLVSIGAGGGPSSNGSHSVLGSLLAVGGGRGGTGRDGVRDGLAGGSGGGTSGNSGFLAGTGTTNQGRAGGLGDSAGFSGGGGGGGASTVGGAAAASVAGSGGAGVASTITGSSVTRAGGGGGGIDSGTAGSGGAGGGGAGGTGGSGVNGTVNTGSGGGGSGAGAPGTPAPGSGGSGIILIKYPDSLTPTIGVGLTSSTSSAGGFKTTTFTAGTDTVIF